MDMATAGTFLVVFIALAVLTFGVGPWLWHHRMHVAMLGSALRRRYIRVNWTAWATRLADDDDDAPIILSSSAPPLEAIRSVGNPHSDAAEPPRNHPRSEDRERGSQGVVPTDRDIIWEIDEVLISLAGLTIRWPDGRVESISTSKLADLYGGRRQDALAHVKALLQPEPVPASPAYDPDQHLLIDNGRRIIER